NPAPMITNPAERNWPTARRNAAPILITRPRKVRTLGWILERARPRTIRRITLLQAQPMACVKVIELLCPRLLVYGDQLHNLHFPNAARNLDFNGIADVFAQQAA